MKRLNKQNLIDILYGCTILGTGGGGSLQVGIKKIESALEENKEFILVDFDELRSDDLIATPYSCGAISPLTEIEINKYKNLPISDVDAHVIALTEMEKHLNKQIKAVVSTELGGGNTATALYAGAMSGKMIVDADPAGRSVPELQHSTYFLNGIKIEPIVLVNKFGETAVITKVTDDFRAEALVRAMAVASQNSIAVVDHVAKAEVLKNSMIRGAISQAMYLGEAYRKAKDVNKDVAEAVAEQGKGIVTFRGTIEENIWDTVDGFTVGDMKIKGKGSYSGDIFSVWYKNENIITKRNGKHDATVPDLVCIINDDLKEPLLNPFGKKGMNVSVVVLPSPKQWTTEDGLKLFGPKSFGYDIEWKPYV